MCNFLSYNKSTSSIFLCLDRAVYWYFCFCGTTYHIRSIQHGRWLKTTFSSSMCEFHIKKILHALFCNTPCCNTAFCNTPCRICRGGGYSVCSKLSLCRTVQAFFFTFYLASTFFFHASLPNYRFWFILMVRKTNENVRLLSLIVSDIFIFKKKRKKNWVDGYFSNQMYLENIWYMKLKFHSYHHKCSNVLL